MATSTIKNPTCFLKVENVTLDASSSVWTMDPDHVSPDFPMRAAISVPGVTSAMFPQVVFGTEEAMSGKYAPISTSGANVIYVYADGVPEADVSILSAVAFL